jgi:hypothetical protein
MEEIFLILLLGVALVVAVLLTTPYEAVAEVILAFFLIVPVIIGFSFQPRKDVL